MLKKIVLALCLAIVFASNGMANVFNNIIVSRGKTVYTSLGEASYLVDNKFNSTAFKVTDNSWIAIDLGSEYRKFFVNINMPNYSWSDVIAAAHSCKNNYKLPTEYTIQVSVNSTNGADGDWTLVDSISNNVVTARGHVVDVTGARWVKIYFTKGEGSIDEIEVFDFSISNLDSWFFVGTSISANTYKGTPPTKNFADIITENFSYFTPAMVRGGIPCINSGDLVSDISKYLQIAGNVRYWAIEMGTNDAWGGSNANAASFKKNLQIVIDSCRAHGIEPIIARVLSTNPVAAKWQVHADFLKAVDDLTTENQLIPGPDLYNWFLTFPSGLDTDGVHPNARGAASIQLLWAQQMVANAPTYFSQGCIAKEIVPFVAVNQTKPKLSTKATLTEGDTLTLSPNTLDAGIWEWTGPNGFTSNEREIVLKQVTLEHAGEYIVTYSGSNICDKKSSVSYTITIKEGVAVSKIQKPKNMLGIYPNPSLEGAFNVNYEGNTKGAVLKIFDIQGVCVFKTNDVNAVMKLNPSLPNGIYMLQVISDRNTLTRKLIIE